MAEFIRTEEKVINVDEPVIFENNTDSDFSVSAAIVFRKSGLHDVSIEGGRTIISKVAERKKGKWLANEEIVRPTRFIEWHCSSCGGVVESAGLPGFNFCPNCGADMRGE